MDELQVSFRRHGEERTSAQLYLPSQEESYPAVIVAAPSAQSIKPLAEHYLAEGIAVAHVDTSTPYVGRPGEAIRAVLDFIDEEETEVDRGAIGLLAFREQAEAALHCAAVDHRIRAIVLVAPEINKELLTLAEQLDTPLLLLCSKSQEHSKLASLFAETYHGPVDIGTLPSRAKQEQLYTESLAHFVRCLQDRSLESDTH
jgi:hypothetical protein